MDLADRVNVLTGDNGLGKSFLLDVMWWALTRTWPAEVNTALLTGGMARPYKGQNGKIEFAISGRNRPDINKKASFDKNRQKWILSRGRPAIPGLVIYAQVDGGFSVWDPARNYWSDDDGKRNPAFVFTAQELWNGLKGKDQYTIYCNGLIRDWESWQRENGRVFELFCKVLEGFSASEPERIHPGGITRISTEDVRDMPSIVMPYGQQVPIIHASAGVNRVLGLAYLLVWAWKEHQIAADLRGEEPTNQIVFLIDEIECHLHPKWQRLILGALLKVVDTLSTEMQTQVVCATHSPLVMTSLEDFFDVDQDAWFDIDLEDGKVKFQKRTFYKRGNAENWLTGEAFDLKSSRSVVAEQVVEEVSDMLLSEDYQNIDYDAIDQRLQSVLPEDDEMLQRFRYFRSKRT